MQNLFYLTEKLIYAVLLLIDRIRGLDFHESVIERVGGGYYYECTHIRILRQLKRVLRSIDENDSIIDVGCGKGRMLSFFSHYPFKRIAGLELNEKLAIIAEYNMAKLNIPARIIRADAAKYERWDSYNYFYLYNPFPENVMEAFLKHLKESIKRNPRKIWLLYVNAECHEMLLSEGFAEIPYKRTFIENIWRKSLSELRIYCFDTSINEAE